VSAKDAGRLQVEPQYLTQVLDALQTHLPGKKVLAFGSRVAGGAKPYSDLDLAVVGDEPVPIDQMAALAEALSESDLPWKVDLVDWALASDRFRVIIEADSVTLQE
jgi:predicted nucleotidyltransferase